MSLNKMLIASLLGAAVGCTPVLPQVKAELPPLQMKVIGYASPLDGATVYLSEGQFREPEVQKYFAQKVVQANDDYFEAHPCKVHSEKQCKDEGDKVCREWKAYKGKGCDKRQEDWDMWKALIEKGEAVVLEPVEGGLVACVEGYVQLMSPEYKRKTLVNGKCDLAERFPNYAVPLPKEGPLTAVNYTFDFAAVLSVKEMKKMEIVNHDLLYQPLSGGKK